MKQNAGLVPAFIPPESEQNIRIFTDRKIKGVAAPAHTRSVFIRFINVLFL